MAKKIFTFLFAVLLLAGILFGVCYWIGSRPDTPGKPNKFSVAYEGEEVTDEINGIGMSTGEPLTLTVTGNFICTVTPYKDVKLTFKEGDKSRELSEFADMTAGFRITQGEDDTLTVTPVGGLSDVIAAVTGKDASVGKYDDSADLFTLLIQSEDGKEVRKIHFGLYRYEVDSVKLSDKEIRF